MQTIIYEFLQEDIDPLFKKITKLKIGETIKINEHEIILNDFNFYEIASNEIHEVFQTKENLYEELIKLI